MNQEEFSLRVERTVYQQEQINNLFGYDRIKRNVCQRFSSAYKEWKPVDAILNTVPIFRWLPKYHWRRDLGSDIVAGLTVAIMHIPQGMAYSLLANVSPIVGLYMAFFPVLAYLFFGTSRHISMGTFAVVCLMTGKVVDNFRHPETMNINSTISLELETYTDIEIAMAITFTVGIIQLIMYVLQLGVVCTLLSDTLVNGFTTGAAIHVLVSQIKDLFGLNIQKFKGPFKIIYTTIELVTHIPEANTAVVIVSLSTIIVLIINNEFLKALVAKKTKFPIPIELITIVAGTLISTFFNLEGTYSINIVGDIPTGLPEPTLPPLKLIPLVAIDSFIITMVAYTVSISMAFIFAQKLDYEIEPNQELLAQGCGNIVGSFFSCLPFSASLSRSLIQQTVGGKTQLTSLVSCLFLLITLLWIGPFFETLPRCILASIIVVSLKGMLWQMKSLPDYWRLSSTDGIIWLITFFTVVIVDIDYGLLAGIVFSLIAILIRGTRPYACLLGVIPGTDLYLDTSIYKLAESVPEIKIYHYRGGLNFATTLHFKNELYRLIGEKPKDILLQRNLIFKQKEKIFKERNGHINPTFITDSTDSENNLSKPNLLLKKLIFDFSALSYIDPSGAKILYSLANEYKKIDIEIYIAATSGAIYDKLRRCGLFNDIFSLFKFFPTIHDAIIFSQITSDNSQTCPNN